MGTQLALPAHWARDLWSYVDPVDRLVALDKDVQQSRADIREILERLADKYGATPQDVAVAMRSIDDTLGDLLYERRRLLEHEIEDGLPTNPLQQLS
jgi:hypothetical protein